MYLLTKNRYGDVCIYLDTVELLAPVLLLVEFARTPTELRARFFKSVPMADNICLEWLSIGAELFWAIWFSC